MLAENGKMADISRSFQMMTTVFLSQMKSISLMILLGVL